MMMSRELRGVVINYYYDQAAHLNSRMVINAFR